MRHRSPSRHRGYALMMVMAISLVLSIGIGTLLTYLAAAEKNSGRQRLNREAYYVCDGVGRIISRTTVDVLSDSRFASTTPTDNLEDLLMDEVEAVHGARLATLLGGLRQPYEIDGPDGFNYKDVDASSTFGQVGLGRFSGMNGQRRTFTYDLALRRSGGSTCRTTATIDTVRVPLSELALFSVDDLRICPSWQTTDVTRFARYHVNGELVVGKHALPKTTATGSINAGCGAAALTICGTDGPCVGTAGGVAIAAAAASAGLLGDLVTDLLADGQRGTSELKYPASLSNSWRGQFADDPGATAPVLSNAGSLRYLVDPPTTTDDSAALTNRLARLAQIRILDGVWYLNDGTWPGQAIWSDHGGEFTLQDEDSAEEHQLVGGDREIGQGDLFGATVPKRFSYYRPGPMPTSDRPVVSYGELASTGDHWEPGRGTTAGNPFDRARTASKSGFTDLHNARYGTAHSTGDPGRVLPINIDLGALNAALDSTDTNELGARMQTLSNAPGLSALADKAQIIVWVGATWTGSLDGRANGTPTPLPRFPGCSPSTEACEEGPTSISSDAPVPWPMCSKSGTAAEDEECDTAKTRRINAVRVFNGQAAQTRRITIATHMPLYVLGSMDRGAATISPGMPGLAAPTVLPGNSPDLFFAADTVTLLSDHWVDGNTWQIGVPGGLVPRSTPELNAPPAYNASFLVGRYSIESAARTPYGAERALRFLERWPVADASSSPVVTGSILIGFKAVHNVAEACYGTAADTNCSTSAPWRHFWSEALLAESQAPPGMPTFALRGIGETLPDSFQFNFHLILQSLPLPAF